MGLWEQVYMVCMHVQIKDRYLCMYVCMYMYTYIEVDIDTDIDIDICLGSKAAQGCRSCGLDALV